MYKYEDFREAMFTDEAQRTLIKARDKILEILERSGVITLEKASACIRRGGDNWERAAYIDRLVEMGELREVQDNGSGSSEGRMFAKGLG